jgi:hypothetical protein
VQLDNQCYFLTAGRERYFHEDIFHIQLLCKSCLATRPVLLNGHQDILIDGCIGSTSTHVIHSLGIHIHCVKSNKCMHVDRFFLVARVLHHSFFVNILWLL